MELTSRDGNMVVDFYPIKDFSNNIINNRMLKVLSFRGDMQKKMIISRDEFYYQVREYILQCMYNDTTDIVGNYIQSRREGIIITTEASKVSP